MHKLVERVARDMSADRLVEKAANCSWIYCKKVSEDQRPKILIVAESTPAWWSAQAPPARNEWLETSAGWMLYRGRPRTTTQAFRVLLIFVGVTCWAEAPL